MSEEILKTRYGSQEDFDWLCEYDNHVTPAWIKRCLHHNEYIVAIENGTRKGFLRYSLFWGNIPYMDMILVLEPYRREGIGTILLGFLEQEIKKSGQNVLMTSSVIDELEPQTWHKRNNFKESGQLTFGSSQSTPEIFFVKELDVLD